MAFEINSKRIANNTLALYIRLGVTMAISFFTTRIMLQQLGVIDYGLNNLLSSLMSMLAFINSSMGTAVQRFFSIEIGRNNEERLGRIFGVGLYLHIIVAIITFILAEIFVFFFLEKLSIPPDRMYAAKVVFQVSVISLVLSIVNVPHAALLRAREMFSKTALLDVCQAVFRLLAVYLLTRINYDKLIALSFLFLVIKVLYVAAITLLALKFKESRQMPIWDKDLVKQMFTFISMLLLSILASLVKTQGIVALINVFFGLAINAAYAIAMQVSSIVSTFAMNFKTPMVPQMMSSYGSGDMSAMFRIINIGTKIAFVLVMMISIPIMFEAGYILRLWLGEPPEYSTILVILVLVAININSFTYLIYQGVHATGNITKQQLFVSLTYILNILAVYLVFKLGADFASALIVNIVIEVLLVIQSVYFAHKTYGYDVMRFLRGIFLPCLSVAAIIVCVLLVMINVFPSSFVRFISVFCAAEILICSLAFYVIFRKEERKLIVSFVRSLVRK